jgi:hypothetical protein
MLLILLCFKITDWAHVDFDYRDPQNASFSIFVLFLAYLTFTLNKSPIRPKDFENKNLMQYLGRKYVV